MNDKFQSLYNYLKSEGLTDLDQNSFYAEYSSNSNKMGELHSYLKQNNMTDLDVNSFSSEYFDVKKKDVSDASLEQKKEPSSSDTGEKVKQTPLVLSGAKSDGYYSYSGRKGAVYQKKDGEWFVDPKANGEFVKIETNKDSRIKELEKNAVENSSYKFISGEKSAVDTLSSQAKKTEEELSDRRANLEKTIDSINGKNLPMYEEVTRELLTKISDTYTNDLLEIEETGFGYDAVSVKNKLNGKKVTISLGDGGERSEREANLLKGFIKMSLASEPLDRKQKQLNELMQKQSNGEVVDYMTQEPIQEKIDRIKLEMEPLKRNLMDQALSDDYMASAYFSKAEIQNASVKFSRLAVTTADIKAAKEEADANIAWQKQKLDQGKELYDNGELTKDQFQAEYIGPYNKTAESENTKLNQMVESLSKDISDTTSDMEKLNVMAGMNYSVQEKRGSVLGGVGRSFVSGIEKPVRFLIGGEKGLLTDTFAPETTTEEFMTSDDRSMVTNALFGITESFGTALVGVAGGPKGVTASFFGASYVDIKDEMDSPEMAGLPEHEKVILATIYGSTVGFLEKFGITKAMSKTPIGKNLVNVIMRNTFKSIPKGLSAEATEALIKSNIKTALTKYGINVIGGALVEGSTELAQELAGVSIKETYDLIKGADYFESPENLGDLVGRLSESFLLGAIGGGMMTGASQMSHTRKDMMTANQLLAAEALMKDPDLKSIWSMNIKNRVLSGEITKEEGYAEIKRITEVVGTVDKIPMDLNADEKYSSYKLLVEKEQLEAETKGYPESVVAAKLDRIKAIDEELKTISYAVQERKTAQVPVESEAGSGQDVRTGGEEFTKVAFPNISGTEATQRTQEWDEKVKEFLPESKFKTEEEFKSSLEKGNWGMLTAENPDATQVSDADNAAQNEKAVQWLKDKGYDPQTIFGKYDNSEVSFFVENLSESDAVAFANEFKQESVATDKGLVYADGKMNPRVFGEEKYDAADNYYSTIKVGGQNVSFQVEYDFNSEVDTVQNRETSKNLVTEENVDSIYESTLSEDADGTKTGVVKAVRSVIKSLPGVKVFLHNNQDEFIKGVAEASGESTDIIKSEEDVFRSEGQFVNGEIHIDLSNSNPSTVYHEAFHVAINQKGLSVDLAQGLKESISDKTLIERIDNFISMYAESDRKEEMISELGAIMADAESELTTTGAHKFKQFINNLAKKLGLPPIFSETAGAQEIVNFINTVSKNMREGRSIDTETVSPSASRKKRISATNSSNYANLTEDGKGNFVFFHVGSKGYDVIKKSSGDTLATSKKEGSALSKVGGVAMYYTDKNDAETMVSGDHKYAVKVKADKVYDFNSDMNNYVPKAKEEFKSEYPDQQFDPNTQMAYVTKIAGENGYEMVVGEWEGKTRAQSHFELEPSDVQVLKGNTIVKDFDEKYISNSEKGYEAIVPESKESKLNSLYNEIYKKRNEEGVYDDLYRLQENSSKMSQDEITEIIMSSDISNDVKDRYNNILSEKEGKRHSVRKKKISEPNKAVVDAKQKYDLSIERGNSIEKAQQSAINDLKKNDWYKNATDIERESALRDLRKQLGLKEKAAPLVAKVTKDKAKKVIVNEATALKDQIRFEARAARESAADLKGKQRAIASAIKGMVREGKIKSTQGAILVDKLSKLNVDNPVMVGRFIDYAGRLFKDAEYKAKLDTAFTTRRKIKAMMKRDNQAEVVSVAKEFSSIDPSLVEDVDAYNDMAVSVLEGLTKSRISGTEVIVKNRANIKAVSEYTSNELEAQEEYKRQEIMGLHSDLVEAGVISADMSSKEMNALINSIKSEEDIDLKDKEKYVRDYANSVFDTFSAVIDEILETGKDPITGESFDITEDQRSVMKELIGIDTKLMPIKDLIATIDSMNNFITNGITSGVEAKVAYYRGVKSAADLRNQGVKARSMKFFGSKKGATDKVSVGRFWMEQMVTLPMMFDVMFKGVRSSINVMERMGINSFVKGVSTSNKKWTNITDSYTENFKKAKPNGKKFNDVSNIYERGMFAFLSRQNADLGESDFARRVKLVKDSIDRLLKHGDNDQIKKGEVYQEVFDKLGLNDPNTNILDVEARVDKVNREAVKWWVNEWSQHYSDLSDVSNSIYNTVLGKDLNYTPDKFSTIDPTAKSAEEILEDKGGAFSGMLDFVYDKKTGVLMPATNPQGMESGRYVDLDFDSVNAGALKGALIDINTASSIKQISGFLDSKDFSSIVPLVRDRRLFESRIKSSIFRGRNKMPMSNDQIGVLERMSRIVSTVGSSKALGGILQVPKQTIPVAMNTLINAGANNFNPAIALNKDFNEFINKSGYSIANRGIESLNAIETANKITEKYSKAGKVLEGVEKVNQFWLKAFLSKPDVYIARASFHAYYIQDLKAQGVSTKGIDWSTHEINHDAATYAQHMIDRQQHISEGSLAGELFASEEPMRKIVRNVAMPFVSFVTNQKTRMYSDISTIMSKDSSVQDKAIAGKSLGGLTVEIMAFNLIAWGVRELIYQAAAETVGREITDEEKEKRARQQLQYVSANVSKDILSPLPQTDGLVVAAMNEVIDLFAKDDTEGAKKALEERNKALQLKDREPLEGEEAEKWMDKWMEERKFKLSNFEKNGLGVYTIGSEKFSELATINDMANGSFEKENPFGGTQTRYVREEDRKLARQVSILEAAHLAGLLPNEIGSYTRYIIKNIEKNSISENAHNKIKQLKSDLGKKELSIVEDYLASSKRKLEGIKDELDTIEIFGGLETEQQQRDYVKVLEAKGEVTYPDYELIMSGRTSELLK